MRQVMIYPGEDDYWVAEVPCLPGCISQGKTRGEAVIYQRIRRINASEEDGLSVPEERFEALNGCLSKLPMKIGVTTVIAITICILIFFIIFGKSTPAIHKKEVPLGNWMGYEWIAKDGIGPPGPNLYSSKNILVKPDGLHLRAGADVMTTRALGYGTYICVIRCPVTEIDPDMVVSMFNYGKTDYVNEIDIEITKWGDKIGNMLHYTVYPPTPGPKFTYSPPVSISNITTHRFIWSKQGVQFISQNGHKELNDLSDVIAMTRTDISPNINMPLHFIVWMMNNRYPTSNKEIVIQEFEWFRATDTQNP